MNLMLKTDAIKRLCDALAAVLPPSNGICGGPLVGLRAIYEDGTDEDSARHRGWISHEAVKLARQTLADILSTVSD